MRARLKARVLLTFMAGLVFGALIWWASPFVTGQQEPWDGWFGYYGIALIVAGFITALISPRHFWLAPLGIYFGQSIYEMAFLPTGPLLPLGLILGFGFCILALAGAAGAFGVWRVCRRS